VFARAPVPEVKVWGRSPQLVPKCLVCFFPVLVGESVPVSMVELDARLREEGAVVRQSDHSPMNSQTENVAPLLLKDEEGR
jgi:hypothetical protein